MMRLIIFPILLCVLIACSPSVSSIELQNQSPIAEFIKDIGVLSVDRAGKITHILCANLHEDLLWNVGDKADQLNGHLVSNTIVLIGDRQLEMDISSNSLLDVHFVYDDDGNVLGTYSDMSFCYSLGQVVKGKHHSSIETSDTTGKVYKYTFILDVS